VTRKESGVRTLDRICTVLDLFSHEEPTLSLAEICRRLGLPKTTVHRLVTALECQGLLTRTIGESKFRLGYQLLRWGVLVKETLDVRNEALPFLRFLMEKTGETSILSVRDGDVGICVEMVESNQPIRLAMQVGRGIMLHAGASAKVLWAFLPDEEIRRILGEIDLVPVRANTITDPDEMYRDLVVIREQGYATSFEETDEGAMGIAAPVYDHTGQAVAGIGIAAPLARVGQEQVPTIARLVVYSARQLSIRLGAPTCPSPGDTHPDRASSCLE